MSNKINEYQSAEILPLGTAHDTILGIKDFPSIDNVLESPMEYRTDWWFYDESE